MSRKYFITILEWIGTSAEVVEVPNPNSMSNSQTTTSTGRNSRRPEPRQPRTSFVPLTKGGKLHSTGNRGPGQGQRGRAHNSKLPLTRYSLDSQIKSFPLLFPPGISPLVGCWVAFSEWDNAQSPSVAGPANRHLLLTVVFCMHFSDLLN